MVTDGDLMVRFGKSAGVGLANGLSGGSSAANISDRLTCKSKESRF